MEDSTIDLTSAKDVYMTKVPLKSGGYEPRDDEGNLLHQPEKIPRVGFFSLNLYAIVRQLMPFFRLDWGLCYGTYSVSYIYISYIYHIYNTFCYMIVLLITIACLRQYIAGTFLTGGIIPWG